MGRERAALEKARGAGLHTPEQIAEAEIGFIGRWGPSGARPRGKSPESDLTTENLAVTDPQIVVGDDGGFSTSIGGVMTPVTPNRTANGLNWDIVPEKDMPGFAEAEREREAEKEQAAELKVERKEQEQQFNDDMDEVRAFVSKRTDFYENLTPKPVFNEKTKEFEEGDPIPFPEAQRRAKEDMLEALRSGRLRTPVRPGQEPITQAPQAPADQIPETPSAFSTEPPESPARIQAQQQQQAAGQIQMPDGSTLPVLSDPSETANLSPGDEFVVMTPSGPRVMEVPLEDIDEEEEIALLDRKEAMSGFSGVSDPGFAGLGVGTTRSEARAVASKVTPPVIAAAATEQAPTRKRTPAQKKARAEKRLQQDLDIATRKADAVKFLELVEESKANRAIQEGLDEATREADARKLQESVDESRAARKLLEDLDAATRKANARKQDLAASKASDQEAVQTLDVQQGIVEMLRDFDKIKGDSDLNQALRRATSEAAKKKAFSKFFKTEEAARIGSRLRDTLVNLRGKASGDELFEAFLVRAAEDAAKAKRRGF